MRALVKLYFISLILFLSPYQRGLAQTAPSLVINELMINPNNAPSLPPFEFIELYNNSSKTIDLRDISLYVNANKHNLPNYKIAPNQYVILCAAQSATQFARYGNAIPLERWYALNNSSATIKLSQGDIVLDEISYRDSWYNSTAKRNGGWSLERINPNWNCNINLNWSATHSLSDGTPGKNNTILDKTFALQPRITSYTITQNRVKLTLNLESQFFSSIHTARFSLDQNIGIAESVEIQQEKIQLTFSKNLDPQKLYKLQIEDLKICNLTVATFEVHLFEQKNIQAGDIKINETLFNPKESGVDFVELYNASEYPINLQNFKLGNRVITTQFHLFEPHQYLAITTNKKITTSQYPNTVVEHILETTALPPYTNQQGIVTLYSDQSVLLDSVYYSAEMHSAHLIDPKGISLERTTPQSISFHSASTLHGGATPGYQNSTADLDIPQNKITLTSKTFSPNGDGYEDELEINYALINPNYIIAVEIYNEKGQLVKKLAHQNLAGTHGRLTWDGKDDSGNRCSKGHYISFAQIFNHTGKTQNFKQPFVLINSLTRH